MIQTVDSLLEWETMLTRTEEIHMNSIKQDVPSEYFNKSAVATFIITPNHEVIFWNKACEILTGITSPEILNSKVSAPLGCGFLLAPHRGASCAALRAVVRVVPSMGFPACVGRELSQRLVMVR